MSRQTNAEIVWNHLPEMGEEPLQVQKLTTQLPLTIQQVTQALQILKKDGRAINPHGKRTNYWTRYEVPVIAEPAPEPLEDGEELAALPTDPRVQEVERHLARIEGALAGMSSRLGEMQDSLAESAEREARLVELVEHLTHELGGPVTISTRAVGSLAAAGATRPVPRAV